MRIIGNAGKAREVQAVASGALASGDTVVVNTDGTVSVVAGSAESIGTPVVFGSSGVGSSSVSAVFDSSNNKVVVAYSDSGNSSYGTAAVGTVNGTSISFGSPVVFESAWSTSISAAFDSNSNKVVIAYRDEGNSNYGTAVVGTVSGTSISFGTPVVFQTSFSLTCSSVFDNNSNKIVIAYRLISGGASAIVGTVSGTSISFGSASSFESSDVGYISTTYDANAQKVVVAYGDGGNSYYGTAVVGTVSGTSISFGSKVVFESGSIQFVSSTFDSNANKVVISYQDGSNSSYGTAVVGTVSGTSISFGTPQVFNSTSTFYTSATFDTNQNKVLISFSNANSTGDVVPTTVSGTSLVFDDFITFEDGQTEFLGSTFDTSQNSFVAAYRDGGNSNKGTGSAVQVGSTTLTSDNYIGTAATGAPSGQGAKINIKGAVADVPSTGYSVSSTAYDDVSFSVASQETTPQGVTFNNNGTKMYVVGSISDRVHQYSLSAPYDLASASYDSVSLNLISQDSNPTSIAFSSNGTKLFMLGLGSQSVHQYSLSTAFDLSTASYDSISINVFSQESSRQGVAFNNAGTKMYVVGSGSDNVHQYSLSTAFDLSTASYDSVSFSVASQDANPMSVVFDEYGTKMFIAGNSTDSVYQYSLSTPYDVSTASYDETTFSFASQDVAPLGITFSNDGSKMYMVGAVSDAVYQYSTSVSLTAGQSYYVQTDGTLGTTPADPSVFAGTAVAATKLIVKG